MSGNIIKKLLQSTGMQIILLIFTCGLLLCPAGSALSATISGTISLPGGVTAPAEGIYVDINANDQNSNGWGNCSVTIEEGQPSATYSISVPDDTNASWTISYYYSGDDYLQNGYYSSSGTTWDSSSGTLLPGGQDQPGINLVLLTGKTISGTVSLPSGDIAPAGGIDVDIYASNQNGSGYGYSYVTIAEGASSATYSMIVPDDTTASWQVSYAYWRSEYVQFGYYSSNGTTGDSSVATLLHGGQDHENINFVLLTGKTISGTVSLPSGDIAPAGGIYIDVDPKNQNGNEWGNVTVFLEAGQSSATYSITVLDDTTASWTVRYQYYLPNFQEGSEYVPTGYYSANGTTRDKSAATPLAGGIDHDDINLTLLKKKGMLCFPVRSKDGQISIISM